MTINILITIAVIAAPIAGALVAPCVGITGVAGCDIINKGGDVNEQTKQDK